MAVWTFQATDKQNISRENLDMSMKKKTLSLSRFYGISTLVVFLMPYQFLYK